MEYECALCGTIFQPSVGHQCKMPPKPVTPSAEFLTLIERLEKLSRENEYLRMQNDILKAKKEIKNGV